MKSFWFFIFSVIVFSSFLVFNTVFAFSTLYFSNPTQQIKEGEKITIYLRVKSQDENINAISGVISYPDNLLKFISISKQDSIINLWVGEPRISKNKISFEGVILNPGFQGENGLILKVIFEAKNKGKGLINFIEGSTLANDGLGSNILAKLNFIDFNIIENNISINDEEEVVKNNIIYTEDKLAKLPVIIDYPQSLLSKDRLYLVGKGEPNSLTKIIFKDVSLRSIGEELLARIQINKKRLDSVLVKNDEFGNFKYESNENLLAGVYNATPFLVDEKINAEKPGLGIQLSVKDNKIDKNYIVILINVFSLFIPIVIICVIIYFIIRYFYLRKKSFKKNE